MPITTIFFDLGNVLVDVNWNMAFYHLKDRTPHDEETLHTKAFGCEDLFDGMDTGKLENEAFFAQFKERLEFDGTAVELEEIWCDVFVPLEDNIQLARQLAEFYPLGIISNIGLSHSRHLEKTYDFFPLFRHKVYSFEFGKMKPDPTIYEHALKLMDGDKFETLFIDDLEPNIMTPSQMGWQTIHLRPEVNLRLALQSYELNGI